MIADKNKNPEYRGLRIGPQIGLIPIGQDPSSRLFEFAHFRTGEVPVRDSGSGHLEITEKTGLVFVLLPGRPFRMGALIPDEDHPEGSPYVDPQCIEREESPLRDVDLDPFFISKYEMTQGQWLRFTGKNPSGYAPGLTESMEGVLSDCTPIILRHPVELVDWHDCCKIMNRLNMLLPTDAQWEYACRGDTTTIYYSGNDPSSLEGFENMADEAFMKDPRLDIKETMPWNDDFLSHSPVGSFQANPFNLHDMAANVAEWCREILTSSRQKDGKLNPGDGLRIQGIEKGNKSIYDTLTASKRGGDWYSLAGQARSAYRRICQVNVCNGRFGVRPVIKVQ